MPSYRTIQDHGEFRKFALRYVRRLKTYACPQYLTEGFNIHFEFIGSILVCQVAFLAAARVPGISTRHLTSLNSDIVDAQDLVLQIVTASHSNVYLRYSALQRGSRAPFAVGLYFPSVPIPGPEVCGILGNPRLWIRVSHPGSWCINTGQN